MRLAICRLSMLESSEHRSRLCQGFGSIPPDLRLRAREMHHMLESQTHLLVGMALVFYCYASFAWRKKQAVEIDSMRTSAGWLSGELRPPKQ